MSLRRSIVGGDVQILCLILVVVVIHCRLFLLFSALFFPKEDILIWSTVSSYEKWADIQDLRESTSFPPYPDFKSSLLSSNKKDFAKEFYKEVSIGLQQGKFESIR